MAKHLAKVDPVGTRIMEAMTEFTCNGERALGMAEYLDQIVDGRPIGG